ncbi:stage II sporulation protein M [Paenibacillus sp. N1-5-1-14]|uniref:stage II sporulation protein M n=1 Tax=Paenibacillus radicibacter TaxID=2972488 RepID=UPI0021590755|nr:stage II sporulation protein M [Paenibacillus radicibacter]MCR8645756.1 stage II sporulation protein M [Paenibacillus radicibacter]
MSLRALLHHFKEMKVYFCIIVGLFILGIVLGANHWNEAIIMEQMKHIQKLAEQAKDSEVVELAFFKIIFFNNVKSMVLMVLMGLLFGIMPIISIFTNGLLLGFVGNMQEGTWLDLVKGIAPHGVLEIPALFIACAYGLRLGVLVIQGIGSLGNEDRKRKFKDNFIRLSKLMVPLLILLVVSLLIAALIESTVSLWLVQS